MKIEIKMTETVEEIIDRIIEEEGIVSYEYAVVSHNGNEARVIIGGDMLHMDLHGKWNHSGVQKLHLYFDVYFNDEDEAVTYWMSDYAQEMYAFVSAMKCAVDMVFGGHLWAAYNRDNGDYSEISVEEKEVL